MLPQQYNDESTVMPHKRFSPTLTDRNARPKGESCVAQKYLTARTISEDPVVRVALPSDATDVVERGGLYASIRENTSVGPVINCDPQPLPTYASRPAP